MTNVFTCLMKKKFGNGNGSGMDRESIGNGSVKSRNLFAVLFCLLFVGVGNVWGATKTAKYTISTTTSVSLDNSANAPATSSATFATTYSNMNQLTETNYQTLTLKNYGVVAITNITLHMKSNSDKGSGSLSYSTDGGTTTSYIVGTSSSGSKFNTSDWYGSWSTSYVDVSKDVTIITESGKDVVIILKSYQNSIYCESYSITWTTDTYTVTFEEEGGSCATESHEQGTVGESFTLPTASPSSDCARHNWVFAGWKKTSAQTSTTTPPTLYTGTYRPTSNETLYAVYKVTEDATTTYDSNPDCTYDYFYDIMHGNVIASQQGTYAMPASPDDATPGDDYCGEKHFHFIGWLEEQYINDDGTLKDGGAAYIIPAGETGHTAANKNYYAIWSKVE